jgi:hypothetical protein
MLLRARRSSKTSRTCLTLLAIYDPNDRVEGAVFEVTDGDLEMADDYEAGDYERVQAPLGFGELEDGTFWSTLKIELVYRTSWRTCDEAENAIFSYIDTWYTTRRIQGAGLPQPRRIRDRLAHPPDQPDPTTSSPPTWHPASDRSTRAADEIVVASSRATPSGEFLRAHQSAFVLFTERGSRTIL